MSTARDLLRALEDSGAHQFSTTRLAADRSPVVRQVRRHRATRTGIGAFAAVATVTAGGWFGTAAWQARQGVDAPIGAPAQPAASPSGAEQPAIVAHPAGNLLDAAPEGSVVAETAGWLAATYDVSVGRAREALVDALPPEAGGEPEGWVAAVDAAAPATIEDAARVLVEAQVANLRAAGVAPDAWQETLTIASLLVAQVPDAQDWPGVSGMILNRLAQDMRLELDSTVLYLSGSAGPYTTAEERAIDSPYNTYLHAGLPPTAIASPGLAAIDAALHPAPGDQRYFIIDPTTGRAVFADTYADFLDIVSTVIREGGTTPAP